jgi:hypothetical protein
MFGIRGSSMAGKFNELGPPDLLGNLDCGRKSGGIIGFLIL